MTYREVYAEGMDRLKAAGVPEYEMDARLLLEHVCNTDRNYMIMHGDEPVSSMYEEEYFQLINIREKRIPLQHITGTQNFMGLDFMVNEHVLIPRQDTEILVEEVLKELHDGMRILDMCTGSGCILISLLNYSNNCEGLGVDISDDALDVAAENAAKLIADKDYKFKQGDLFEAVPEGTKFDVIVSNPPYIASGEIPGLMPEVKDHEPMLALDGTEDGLFFYKTIIDKSRDYLYNGASLYFEIGYDQGQAVSKLMTDAGFRNVEIVKDYAGLDRVVFGTF